MYTKLLFFPKESRASWRPNVREKEKVAGALFFSAPLPNGILLLLCRGEEGNRDWQTTFSILSLSSGLEWKWGKFFFLLPTSFRYQRTGSLDVVITILMALMNSAQKVQISCLSTFFKDIFPIYIFSAFTFLHANTWKRRSAIGKLLLMRGSGKTFWPPLTRSCDGCGRKKVFFLPPHHLANGRSGAQLGNWGAKKNAAATTNANASSQEMHFLSSKQ